jgi:hypothetical protein
MSFNALLEDIMAGLRRRMVRFSMLPLSEWQTLLSVQASAAATLTGLVFVAVSINLAKIIAFPGLPSRAAESIVQFLQVFFICTAMLIPRQPTSIMAAKILAVSLFSWVMRLWCKFGTPDRVPDTLVYG